jgi:ATP-binding cassette subfamily C protein
MTLPKGYETEVGELGSTLSGGERQRIGLARAFLHDAPFMLLDEPTSNLDSLNEAVILRSLDKEKGEKTIILVSHRQSTMRIADEIRTMDSGRLS